MTEWEKFERMVNLKSESVELGVVQDLEKMSESVFIKMGNLEDTFNAIDKAQKDMTSAFMEMEKELSKYDAAYGKFLLTARELGIDVPKTAENSYKSTLAVVKNSMAEYKKRKTY